MQVYRLPDSMNGHVEEQILYLPSPDREQELRLHLDENIGGSVARLLRGQGYDVTTTTDVGLRSQSDVSHMSYAAEQQRIIVTRDRDFLQLHAEDCEHSGIVYWPHNETASLSDMQELLIRLLQRISEAPTQGAGLPTEFHTTGAKKKSKKRKKKNRKAPHPVSNRLPAGIAVQGTVRAVKNRTLEVRLKSGQTAWVAPHRLPRLVPQIGDEVQAVTFRYIKAQKQLHLSMRRLFRVTRSVSRLGMKQLRRNDLALVREVREQWPVEMEIEEPHLLHLYGQTADAVREALSYLHRQVPWTASAIITLDKAAFRTWMRETFNGGVGKMSLATGTLVRYHPPKSLVVCAPSNYELDGLLNLIHSHVPDLQIIERQSARGEPLMPCRWESI